LRHLEAVRVTMKNARLFLSHFVAGLGSMFALAPRRESKSIQRIRKKKHDLRRRSDWNAIRDDWRAVGGDIHSAMKRIGVE